LAAALAGTSLAAEVDDDLVDRPPDARRLWALARHPDAGR